MLRETRRRREPFADTTAPLRSFDVLGEILTVSSTNIQPRAVTVVEHSPSAMLAAVTLGFARTIRVAAVATKRRRFSA